MTSLSLLTFLREAAHEVEHGYTVQRFLALRYDELYRQWPHAVFGLAQCNSHFFADSADRIDGTILIEPDALMDEYGNAWRAWLREHKSQLRDEVL